MHEEPKQQTKICSFCNKPNEPVNLYCKYCGRDFPEGDSGNKTNTQQTKEEIFQIKDDAFAKNTLHEKNTAEDINKKPQEDVILQEEKEPSKHIKGSTKSAKHATYLVGIGILAFFVIAVVFLSTKFTSQKKPSKRPATSTTSIDSTINLRVQKAVMRATDTSGKPSHELGYNPTLPPGTQRLCYYVNYSGAKPHETKFISKWYKDGNQIHSYVNIVDYASGSVWNSFEYNYQPGQYRIELYVNDRIFDKTLFSVRQPQYTTPTTSTYQVVTTSTTSMYYRKKRPSNYPDGRTNNYDRDKMLRDMERDLRKALKGS
ncbi:MAG: hypothetical protein JW832_16135 [Deltaproteobacteria bacterium]|nr:hypothetical protein [Deltaproteobacteria bacterium]